MFEIEVVGIVSCCVMACMCVCECVVCIFGEIYTNSIVIAAYTTRRVYSLLWFYIPYLCIWKHGATSSCIATIVAEIYFMCRKYQPYILLLPWRRHRPAPANTTPQGGRIYRISRLCKIFHFVCVRPYNVRRRTLFRLVIRSSSSTFPFIHLFIISFWYCRLCTHRQYNLLQPLCSALCSAYIWTTHNTTYKWLRGSWAPTIFTK